MFQGRHICRFPCFVARGFLPLVDLILEAFFDEREVQPQHE